MKIRVVPTFRESPEKERWVDDSDWKEKQNRGRQKRTTALTERNGAGPRPFRTKRKTSNSCTHCASFLNPGTKSKGEKRGSQKQ